MNDQVLNYGISLVAPAHNEEEGIALFIEKSLAALKPFPRREIIIVNDASTDGTGDVLDDLAKLHPELKVFHSRRRLGITGAVWKGFKLAEKEIIIFLP